MHFCFTVAIRTVALAQHSLPTIAVEQEMNLQISFSFFNHMSLGVYCYDK